MTRALVLYFALLLAPGLATAQSDFGKMAHTCANAVTAPEETIKACGWLLEVDTLDEEGRASVYYLRGVASFVMKDWDRARRDFGEAIQFHSRNPNAYVARGSVYYQLGKYERAIRDFDAAIKIQPNMSEAFNKRANTQVKIGRHESALGDYEKAIRFRSKFIAAFIDRSMAHRRDDRHEDADADIREAILIAEGSAEANNRLGWHFATADDPRARNGERAIEFATRAVALRPISPYIDTLAAAYSEAGRFDDAVREQKRAIEAFESGGENNAGVRLADLQARLELYRGGEAYREVTGRANP